MPRSASSKRTIKTAPNTGNVRAFLDGVGDETRRRDALTVLNLMKSVTRQPPRMWGTSIVGFGRYSYTYADGRVGEMCAVGFAPRANDVTLYLTMDFKPFAALLKRLGKHTIGKSCLHIRKFDDIDGEVLRELVTRAYRSRKQK